MLKPLQHISLHGHQGEPDLPSCAELKKGFIIKRQCFPALVLGPPCPACFRRLPASTHLIQTNRSVSGFCRALVMSSSFEC